jgi:hypothetical protein
VANQLHRYYGAGYLHFITTSCYRRLPLLGKPQHRDLARFYDFVVFTETKRVEKLRYMHRNPGRRGLVLEPQQWDWSSCRHYAHGERGMVLVNEEKKAELKVRQIA